MSEAVVSGASAALSGAKTVLGKAAPWLGMLAGVFVGSFVNGLIFNAIFRMAGVEAILSRYTGTWTPRLEWALVAGIMTGIGVALWKMMHGPIGHTIGFFFIGCGIRALIDCALGSQGPYYAPPAGA